jgi:hypothetical protein
MVRRSCLSSTVQRLVADVLAQQALGEPLQQHGELGFLFG